MSRSRWYRLSTFRAALQIAQILPRSIQQEIAGAIGHASFARNPRAREALRANLRRVTGFEGETLDELCRENFGNFLKMLADYFLCTQATPDAIRALVSEWQGARHLEAARDSGKGGIFVTAHLGNWELGAMVLALHDIPLTVVTLEEPSSELTRWREDYRKRLGVRTVAVGSDPFSFVSIIAALRRGEFVAMLVDRPYAGSGIPVNFFGERAEFSTAPSLLHQHTNAAVMPAWVLQNENGRYISRLDAPVEMTDDAAANAQRIATAFESTIRAHPEQWFNYVSIWNAQ